MFTYFPNEGLSFSLRGEEEGKDLGLAAAVGVETLHQLPDTAVMNQKGAFGSFFI